MGPARIEQARGPVKVDWSGPAYRWICGDCVRHGGWEATPGRAQLAAAAHNAAKHKKGLGG